MRLKPYCWFFDAVVRTGSLIVIDADGKRHEFGDGTGRPHCMRLTDRSLHWRIALRPSLAIGEGYMAGTLIPEATSLPDLLTLLMTNEMAASSRGLLRVLSELARRVGRWMAFNGLGRARRNVAHHYDLKDELFALFLDPDRYYSCAYFEGPRDNLAHAQARKAALIARKLAPSPNHRVLDIGSGWGGLGMLLARTTAARVTGITLSVEQCRYASARAGRLGLGEQCQFHVRDYRAETGTYDRIVSIGMLEHVGPAHYDAYFGTVARCLAADGVALIHAVGAFNRAGPIPAFIAKYIFPGAYVPTLSEVIPPIERAGLKITDIEIWRLHYAETLAHWRANFLARRAEAEALYDARFCRMWEFYLAACEVAFRIGDVMVFQIQIAKRQDAVPLTRRYLFEAPAATDTAQRGAAA